MTSLDQNLPAVEREKPLAQRLEPPISPEITRSQILSDRSAIPTQSPFCLTDALSRHGGVSNQQYISPVYPLDVERLSPNQSEDPYLNGAGDFMTRTPLQKAEELQKLKQKWESTLVGTHEKLLETPSEADRETIRTALFKELDEESNFESQIAFTDALLKLHETVGDDGVKLGDQGVRLVLGKRYQEFAEDEHYQLGLQKIARDKELVESAPKLATDLKALLTDVQNGKALPSGVYLWLDKNRLALPHIRQNFDQSAEMEGNSKLTDKISILFKQTSPELEIACQMILGNQVEESRLEYIKWAIEKVTKVTPKSDQANANFSTYLEPFLKQTSGENLYKLSTAYEYFNSSKLKKETPTTLKEHLFDLIDQEKIADKITMPVDKLGHSETKTKRLLDYYFNPELHTQDNIDTSVDIVHWAQTFEANGHLGGTLIAGILTMRRTLTDAQCDTVFKTFDKLYGKTLPAEKFGLLNGLGGIGGGKSPEALLTALCDMKLGLFEVQALTSLWAIENESPEVARAVLDRMTTKAEFNNFNDEFSKWVRGQIDYAAFDSFKDAHKEVNEFIQSGKSKSEKVLGHFFNKTLDWKFYTQYENSQWK